MSDSSSARFQSPGDRFSPDPLTECLRSGAQQLLQSAIEAEVSSWLAEYEEDRTGEGHRRVVRNGHLPVREIQTGIGGVAVKVPRVGDRGAGAEKVVFHSKLIPPYLRRAKSVEELLPWLYLKGVSTGDFSEALASLLGSEAAGLSSTTISRLKKDWIREYDTWRRRDLSKRRIVYVWADGIYSNIRMDEAKLCLLVIIGADDKGQKHLLAVEEGYRESTQSWREVLLDLKRRGLTQAPKLAVGDGSLGFWKALTEVYPATRPQRCWVHKTGNILNYLPKSSQPKAKKGLHEIWMASTREEALKAFDSFVEIYEAKYPKAVACLEKDRDELLAFYDFPAQQWPHLRTTNPIESTFATVRLRTAKTRGCLSRETALTMVFELTESAQKRWQRLRGFDLLADVVRGVRFINGEHPKTIAA